MKKWLTFILTYILPAGLGVLLVYATFKNIELNSIINAFKHGNYWVIAPVALVSILVYVLRVIRWKLLYKTVGIHANSYNLFASLATGYAVNFAVPRLGEITRAIVMQRKQGIKVNQSLATIVFERVVDTFCLGIIAVTVIVLEWFNKEGLFGLFEPTHDQKSGLSRILIILAVIMVLVLWLLLKKSQNQIIQWIKTFFSTLLQLLKLKNKALFFATTLGIWVGFYLMTYLWFFMFKESGNLTFYQAYTVMFFGVIARSLPIQAGSAGAYHFVVTKVLVFYGIGTPVAGALAIIIHGFQSILTLLLGLMAYLWLLFFSKK
jgi:uncharacterized membrane protein YbhN (UPF0104 family)